MKLQPTNLAGFMRKQNADYYSQVGPKGIDRSPLGFTTPSYGKQYARLNAQEFAQFAEKKAGKLSVWELGAADGVFARNFLDSLQEISPSAYSRTEYFATDRSEANIPLAKEKLAKHRNAIIGAADALGLGQTFPKAVCDYMFCHELFDDLASTVVAKCGCSLHELWFVPFKKEAAFNMEFEAFKAEFRELRRTSPGFGIIQGFMQGLPEKLRVAFPVDGIDALHEIDHVLKKGAALKIFDYGYLNRQIALKFRLINDNGNVEGRGDIFSAGYCMVGTRLGSDDASNHVSAGMNENVQITSPVNFPVISSRLKCMGYSVKLEPHLGWASRVSGEPQTSPSHYSAGFAYCGKGMGINEGLLFLASAHKAFTVFKDDIIAAIKRHGDNETALFEAINSMRNKGIFIPARIIPPNGQGKPARSFVISSLKNIFAQAVLESGVFERLRAKSGSTVQQFLDIVPDSSQSAYRAQFSREISELEQMGFDRKALEWGLFQYPFGHRISGSMSRVCLTAYK
ncbi:MAG: SAM-dependent methyltransferase [Candidatus Micrarchaeota archaeon]|nr:SAM-dependent methyltransferase [Candidatus Micrarchaeota archaeon]